MTRTFTVHGRAGYYPADSAIVKHYGVGQLPRKVKGTVVATSASDACAKMAAWFKQQQTDALPAVMGNIPTFLLFEPTAVVEVLPTAAELLASMPATVPPVRMVRAHR